MPELVFCSQARHRSSLEGTENSGHWFLGKHQNRLRSPYRRKQRDLAKPCDQAFFRWLDPMLQFAKMIRAGTNRQADILGLVPSQSLPEPRHLLAGKAAAEILVAGT